MSVRSEQIGSITSKVNMKKYGYCLNTELKLPNEKAVYQEYIICLKKYQIALK